MRFTQTLHDAAGATREYAKGIDRATAIRRLFAFWMAFTIVVSLVPPGVLYLGGPNLAPIGTVSAEAWNSSDIQLSGTFDVSGEASDPQGLAFKPDGTKMYVVNRGGFVHQYDLSTAWDATSASAETEFNASSEDTDMNEVAFNDDGTKMFTVGAGGDSVYEYSLSTAWNVSSASFTRSFDVSGDGEFAPRGLAFNDSGSRMYVTGSDTDAVLQYELSEAYNISTASLDTQFSVSSQTSIPTGVAFGDGGSKMYIVDNDVDNLNEYDLSTPYNVSSASHTRTVNIGSDTNEPTGVRWGKSGARMFMLGATDTEVHQYDTVGGVVSGTVTFAENGTAAEGASITVNASDASDTTDASGFYSLGLDNGTYEITATKGDLTNSITVTVSGSDLTNQNITLSDEELSLDVPTHMFPNETAAYEVTLEGSDVTDAANVTSSDPTNLTVNETSNELEATSNTDFAAEVTITAEHDGLTAERNVTVANLSASNVALMQNAADMTAAIWGDVQGPSGERPGGTQLTMRVLFVALLIGAAIATHASGFAGIGGITLIVVMGWFMGWVSDGMALVTVFTGLFIGLNLAANIDYSVRK